MRFRSGANPAALDGRLQHLLPKVSKTKAEDPQPAVAQEDAKRWWAHLAQMDGQGARALGMAVLCASRSGEIRGLTWGEVEFGKDGPERIAIPANRMKSNVSHGVPLSSAAVEVLPEAAGLRDGEAWPEMPSTSLVFPAVREGELSDMTLSAVMRRMNKAELEAKRQGYLDSRSRRPAVPHGCRSTFKDWALEAGYPHDLSEEALAHSIGDDVVKAYARTQRVEQRRPMMEAWAEFLAGEAAPALTEDGPMTKAEALAPTLAFVQTLARLFSSLRSAAARMLAMCPGLS